MHSVAAFAGAWIPAPGERFTEVRPGLFSSDSYHDRFGYRHALVGGGLYEQRTVTTHTEVGWKNHTSFFFTLPAVSVTRRDGDGSYIQSQSGFGDVEAGFRIGLKRGASALALQLEWIGPAGYRRTYTPIDAQRRRHAVDGSVVSPDVVDVAEQAPTLGRGRQSGRAMLQFGAPVTSRAFFELAGGYRKYDSQYAAQYVASADLGIWLSGSVMLAGRYRGAIATGEGESPGDKLTEHLSGPVLLYRLDDHMDVMAGSFHTASAKNALHVDQFYVAVAVKKTGLNRLQGFLGNKRLP